MLQKVLYLSCCLVLCVASLSLQAAEKAVVRRAVFDIGSGATRMIVADVNTTKNTVTIIKEKAVPVAYKMDLAVNHQGAFSPKIRAKGLAVLAQLKQVASQQGAKAFAAVATSAFRSATNGAAFAKEITKRLGIPVTIITQQQEAILGFIAALAGEQLDPQKVVVWDIGGGSMQMTMRTAKQDYVIYYGKVASVSFARYIIEKIQGKNMQQVKTPNPISPQDAELALAYLHKIAAQVPPALKERLQDPQTTVLGIGGVHYYSIRLQVKQGKTYTLEGVKNTLGQRLGLTDKQIGGKYARTEVGNLILVSGFMESLHIKKVRVKKVNMGHAILLYAPLWK